MSDVRTPFASLTPREDGEAVRAAIDRVVRSGWYVLGPEVEAFEREFAEASGAAHAVGVGTGTDAIALTLRGLGIGPGDEVVTTPLSAAYSALAILMSGARPVFVDIDPDRLTIDPAAVERAVTANTRAILPVHLYGQAADMTTLEEIARRHRLAIVEDCCQAVLGHAGGRPVGTSGVAAAFSFYPTKNLGALGDGGAVVTNDAALAERIRRLRNGGQARRYEHTEPGVNARLDEIQAAILRARLPFLTAWTATRRTLARRYRDGLSDSGVVIPRECDPGHVYHLFVVLAGGNRRDELRRHLGARGIETLVHYPLPIPAQRAFGALPPSTWPVTDAVCRQILSLPLHPGLDEAVVDEVVAAVRDFH